MGHTGYMLKKCYVHTLAVYQGAEKEQPAHRQERTQRLEREQKDQGQGRKPAAGHGDSVAGFTQAQKEFIQVAGSPTSIPRPRCARAIYARK